MERGIRLRMRHEDEVVSLIVHARRAVLVINPVEAVHQAAHFARLHNEVERMLDRDPDVTRDRHRREGAGQLLSAERRLAWPKESRARLGGSGPAQGVPLPVAVGIPEHAVVGALHDQAGVPAVVEDADLGRIGDAIRRKHARRAPREPERGGNRERAAWTALPPTASITRKEWNHARLIDLLERVSALSGA